MGFICWRRLGICKHIIYEVWAEKNHHMDLFLKGSDASWDSQYWVALDCYTTMAATLPCLWIWPKKKKIRRSSVCAHISLYTCKMTSNSLNQSKPLMEDNAWDKETSSILQKCVPLETDFGCLSIVDGEMYSKKKKKKK